jgi:hypothetical protein
LFEKAIIKQQNSIPIESITIIIINDIIEKEHNPNTEIELNKTKHRQYW